MKSKDCYETHTSCNGSICDHAGSFTPVPIQFEGWFPPREVGLLPSCKANWDARMLQLFTDDLEQGERDMKLLTAVHDLFFALQSLYDVCRVSEDPASKPMREALAALAKARGQQ